MVMLTRVSWVVLVILATITVSESEDIIAKDGSSLFLPCRGNDGKVCTWTASYSDGRSDVVAMSNNPYPTPRYHLTDSPQNGDCSLNITDIESSDMGMLTCTIKPSTVPVIKYNVTVGTQPNDPRIEYKDQTLNDGDVVQIETPAEIKCIVSRGKPGAVINWETEHSYPSNGTKVDNEDTTIDAINTLKIDNFVQELKPEIKIICNANHPLYPYDGHQKSITVTVGEEYETRNVNVEQNTTYASCIADGIPRPTIQWQFRKTAADPWENIVSTQNTTLENSGDYQCVAGNGVNGYPPVASNVLTKNGGEVTPHSKDEDNSKQAGVIAGVVVAVLVVLCIIGGLTLFTYRRKSLCFKERRPIPSNNPGNVENGGKIQTINDEKEKGEIKGDQNDNTKQKEIVYAQLDLPLSQGHNVNTPKSEEKTEYAQIKFQPKENQV